MDRDHKIRILVSNLRGKARDAMILRLLVAGVDWTFAEHQRRIRPHFCKRVVRRPSVPVAPLEAWSKPR